MAEIVEFPGKTAIGCSAWVLPHRLGKYIEDSFRLIAGQMKQDGMPPCGSHFTRYVVLTPVLMRVEVGIEVNMDEAEHLGPLPPPLQMVQLPRCRAAQMVHTGSYESLPNTYIALYSWIRKKNLHPGQMLFEDYLTNPEQLPGPAMYRTSVYWSVSPSFLKSRGWQWLS